MFLMNMVNLNILILENLAIHNPAFQMNPEPGLNVSRANAGVDGLKDNTDIWGDQCVVSGNGNKVALWWVNLIRISSIHHIDIYYVTGRKKWGMLSISMFLVFRWKLYQMCVTLIHISKDRISSF